MVDLVNVVKFYSPSCLGQETAIVTASAHLSSVCHIQWKLHTVFVIAERQAGKL